MLNYIWLGLMLGAVLVGGWNGQLKNVADQSLEWANMAVVNIAFALIGVMALWLGIMRLAERAGLVALLARALRPVLCRIFPEVPAGHPAMGSMVMNIAANMLGLGNAATPLGLRAMKDLESLNRNPGTATNAMCTFLAINTSSVQLVPVTAMAILATNHSSNPSAIVGTSLVATACACTCGVTTAKLMARLPFFKLPPPEREIPAPGANLPRADAETSPVKEAPALQPLRWWGMIILAGFLAFFAGLFIRALVWPAAADAAN